MQKLAKCFSHRSAAGGADASMAPLRGGAAYLGPRSGEADDPYDMYEPSEAELPRERDV